MNASSILNKAHFFLPQTLMKIIKISICPVIAYRHSLQERNALSLTLPLTRRSLPIFRHFITMNWILTLCNKWQISVPTSFTIPRQKLFQEASKLMDLVSTFLRIFLQLNIKNGALLKVFPFTVYVENSSSVMTKKIIYITCLSSSGYPKTFLLIF